MDIDDDTYHELPNRNHPAGLSGGMASDSRFARQLARIVGLFGSVGWAECPVVLEDARTVKRLPVTKEANDMIQYCRKMLKEAHVETITQ